MRARMALLVSQTAVRLREVVLRDKPAALIAASAKATVPVLVLGDGTVIDESLAIMDWALQRHDPDNWLDQSADAAALITANDSEFKFHLDRYKYPGRYDDSDPLQHRAAGLEFLERLEYHISRQSQIAGPNPGLADYAVFPFVRQFADHDRDWFDQQDLLALHKWLAGHISSEIFAAAMVKYPPWQEMAGDDEPICGGS